jgi:hypothetical protein
MRLHHGPHGAPALILVGVARPDISLALWKLEPKPACAEVRKARALLIPISHFRTKKISLQRFDPPGVAFLSSWPANLVTLT